MSDPTYEREQANLLRAADNADAAGVRTVNTTNPLLSIARRNIRQFLAKASFSSEVDRWSAGQCLDVMDAALDRQQPEAEARAQGGGGGGFRDDLIPDLEARATCTDEVAGDLMREAARTLRKLSRTAPPSAPVGVEEMQRRLDREESDHGRTIDQRDAAEDALGRMFQAVTGRPAEWSSVWGYVDAIEEVEEHVAALAEAAELARTGRTGSPRKVASMTSRPRCLKVKPLTVRERIVRRCECRCVPCYTLGDPHLVHITAPVVT